jgi:hypothetical protein
MVPVPSLGTENVDDAVVTIFDIGDAVDLECCGGGDPGIEDEEADKNMDEVVVCWLLGYILYGL